MAARIFQRIGMKDKRMKKNSTLLNHIQGFTCLSLGNKAQIKKSRTIIVYKHLHPLIRQKLAPLDWKARYFFVDLMIWIAITYRRNSISSSPNHQHLAQSLVLKHQKISTFFRYSSANLLIKMILLRSRSLTTLHLVTCYKTQVLTTIAQKEHNTDSTAPSYKRCKKSNM